MGQDSERTGEYDNLSTALSVGESREYSSPLISQFNRKGGEKYRNYLGECLAQLYKKGVSEIELELGVVIQNVGGEEYYQRYIFAKINLPSIVSTQVADVSETDDLEEMAEVLQNTDEEKLQDIVGAMDIGEVADLFRFNSVLLEGVKSHAEGLLPQEEGQMLYWSDKTDLVARRSLVIALRAIEEER